jgi:protease I
MADRLSGRQIAVLATDGVERVEIQEPLQALIAAGATAVIVSPKPGAIRSYDHLDASEEIAVDLPLGEADPGLFDGLVLPGGALNPDMLRTDDRAVGFVRSFFTEGKPVAAICHAPWTLIEAGVVRGRTLTSWPSLRTDLENAGATWVDEEVVTDQGLVTSRRPDDLPAFCATMIEEFAEGRHEGQAAVTPGTGAG